MTDPKFLETEKIELSIASDVIPFCVYHWVDPKMGVHRGFISHPSVIKGEDDNFKYTCTHPNKLNPYGKWSFAFRFYAVNPMVRPIPNGMGLFCAKKRITFPWDTTQVKLVYDPYNISDECVYFIAYTKPVPWTKPLYVHIQGSTHSPTMVFPSWDPNPPIKNTEGKYMKTETKFFSTQPVYSWVGDPIEQTIEEDSDIDSTSSHLGWLQESISPIFVLSPQLFGENYEDIKFQCHNAACYPVNPNNDYIDRVSVSPTMGFLDNPMTLAECVISCNQIVPAEAGGGHSYDILTMISSKLDKLARSSPSLGKRISSVSSPIVISILVAILLVSLTVLVYFSIRNK